MNQVNNPRFLGILCLIAGIGIILAGVYQTALADGTNWVASSIGAVFMVQGIRYLRQADTH
jgi:hypothetical protein